MSASLQFTVIVPTRNRPAALERCLTSLAALRYPGDRYSVVVINDGGEDPSPVVDRLADRLTISLITQSHAGPAAARNTGVARSSSEALAFIDDDCVADAGWLSAFSSSLQAVSGGVIGGRVVNLLDGNIYARTSQSLIGHVYHYYHEERRGPLRFFTTNNLAVSAQTFAAVGGFDDRFVFACEDRDWSDRAMFAGFELLYEQAAIVHHAHDLSLLGLLRQHRKYGQGAVRFHRHRARRRGERVRLEPFRFYAGLLAAPFTQQDPQPLRMAFLLVATQAAATAGFVQQLLMPTD